MTRRKAAPACQGCSSCFTSSEAATIRTRLCIHPVRHSWRIPASTIG